jgi:hypothetical protein
MSWKNFLMKAEIEEEEASEGGSIRFKCCIFYKG